MDHFLKSLGRFLLILHFFFFTRVPLEPLLEVVGLALVLEEVEVPRLELEDILLLEVPELFVAFDELRGAMLREDLPFNWSLEIPLPLDFPR